jgi:hypothetical protein
MLDPLRKGFRFFLMSMGVSTYEKKPAPKPASESDPPKSPAAPPAKPK